MGSGASRWVSDEGRADSGQLGVFSDLLAIDSEGFIPVFGFIHENLSEIFGPNDFVGVIEGGNGFGVLFCPINQLLLDLFTLVGLYVGVLDQVSAPGFDVCDRSKVFISKIIALIAGRHG